MSGTELFGTGLERARVVRRNLLDAFSAEADWTWGDYGDITVTWAPGPLAAQFMIEPVEDAVPGLAVIHVIISCATVFDLEGARAAVADLNAHTTFERWSVLNDPEMDLSRSIQPVQPLSFPLSPRFDENRPTLAVCGVSLIVGDPVMELPFGAMRAMVAGVIAKSTAVATNGFADGWGQVNAFLDDSGNMRSGDHWNRVVYFFDDEITPYRDDPAEAMMGALGEAFELERNEQFQTCPAAWFGSGDSDGFTCEVPYGPGPYPMGVIGMQSASPHPAGPETATSLVRGLREVNPYVGNGLVLAVSTPISGSTDVIPAALLAALLNAQNRLRSDETSPGFAHAVGAWTARTMGITHVTFIPSAWQRLLSREELVQFFRVMLANAARLSWGSRQALEPWRDRTDPAIPKLPMGLAAGPHARGSHFGELGVGQDPGARSLGFLWDNLVGADSEYALLFTDVPGFRFWMGPSVVDVTSRPCQCDDEPGSVVEISSDLGVDSPTLRRSLTPMLDESQPFGVVATNHRLAATAQIHIHDDTLHWGSRWMVPLATAIALIADRLPPAPERGVTLTMPDGSLRPNRDGMLGKSGELGLWDQRSEWIVEGRAQSKSTGLLHALALTGNPGFRVALSGGQVTVSRTYACPGDGAQDLIACVLDTVHGYVEHPTYGRSLLITTQIPTDATCDPFTSMVRLMAQDSTLLGGLNQTLDGVRLSTLYPLALDGSSNYPGQVSFAGTALQHHLVAVEASLQLLEGARGRSPDLDEFESGLQETVSTFRSLGVIPEAVQTTVGNWQGEVLVRWMRPWPYVGADSSPRLASEISFEGDLWLGGQVVLSPEDFDPWPIRAAHAALALSAAPNPALGEGGSLLAELARLPWPGQIGYVYRRAMEVFGVVEDEEGDFVIRDEEGRTIAQLLIQVRDDHQGWGASVDVVARMLVTALVEGDPRNASPTVLGAWSCIDDTLEYRISLPPLLFACLDRRQPLHETLMCVGEVLGRARKAAQSDQDS